jgi:hypothetical protein
MRPAVRLAAALLAVFLAGATAACGGGDDDDADDAGDMDDAGGGDDDAGNATAWEIVRQDFPSAFLSVWGTAPDDVWAVGSDPDGAGPAVLRYDGADWQELDTGTAGDLWWVFGPDGGPVYMGGAGGTILAYRDGEFTAMPTPRTDVSVFGIWGCSPEDMWAVGGGASGSSGGFAWRLQGDAWVEAEGFPAEVAEADAVWKVFGRGCDDVWMVGTAGLAIHWDGEAFGEVERVAGGSLFTVHANSERFVAVGGQGVGIVVENDGSGWTDVAPEGADPIVGVCLTEGGGAAAGWFGSVFSRTDGAWEEEDIGTTLDEAFHSVWVDPSGGVWAAGGQILSPPLNSGVLLHRD